MDDSNLLVDREEAVINDELNPIDRSDESHDDETNTNTNNGSEKSYQSI